MNDVSLQFALKQPSGQGQGNGRVEVRDETRYVICSLLKLVMGTWGSVLLFSLLLLLKVSIVKNYFLSRMVLFPDFLNNATNEIQIRNNYAFDRIKTVHQLVGVRVGFGLGVGLHRTEEGITSIEMKLIFYKLCALHPKQLSGNILSHAHT